MAEACQEGLWFALTVKPRHEKSVAEQLTGRLLEGFAPTYRARRRRPDRIATLDLPLFPGYVFCRSRFEDRLKVLRLSSVTSIVSFGGKPCPVPDEEIRAVQAMVASGLPVEPWRYLTVGQRVRICQGYLAGLEGILVREKAVDRVVINVDLLGQAAAVEIDRDHLEPGVSLPIPERSVPRHT